MKIPNEDKGLNKRRHAMPQIKDFDAFMADLAENDHAVVTLTVDPNELIPTQGNFSDEKVDKMVKDGGWNSKPIISSDDDFVLDGHHRWLAAVAAGKVIKTRVVDMKIEELLDFVKDKPYVETRGINEDMAKDQIRVQNYYNRVARGEGGEQYAKLLNKVNTTRELVMGNKENAMKNRQAIVVLLDRVAGLLTEAH